MRVQAPTYEHLRQAKPEQAHRQLKTVRQKPISRPHSHPAATQKPADSGPAPPDAFAPGYVGQGSGRFNGPLNVPLRARPAERTEFVI